MSAHRVTSNVATMVNGADKKHEREMLPSQPVVCSTETSRDARHLMSLKHQGWLQQPHSVLLRWEFHVPKPLKYVKKGL